MVNLIIRPYFWGGYVEGGGRLTSHDNLQLFCVFFDHGHFCFNHKSESSAHSPVKNSERCRSDRHFTGSSTKP